MPTEGSRCPVHRREQERRRGTPTQRGYDPAWRAQSRATIAAQPWCGCTLAHWWHAGRECGATRDLTAGHVVPLGRGGAGGPSVTECRRCNSAKRDRV